MATVSISLKRPAPVVRIRSIEELAVKKKVLLQDVDAGVNCLACTACPGFQLHVWRKICVHCRCPWEKHDIFHGDDDEEEVDITGLRSTGGPSTRELALQALIQHLKLLTHTQNPLHDREAAMCSSIHDKETMDKFTRLNQRRIKERFKATVLPAYMHDVCGSCKHCAKCIGAADTATEAETEDLQLSYFHFKCFTCQQCRTPIAGPHFYTHRRKDEKCSQRLCSRCHAEQYLPRCAGCDELIFDTYFTQAEGRNWHETHFCCHLCDRHLGGSRYTKTEDNNPLCLPCYNEAYAPVCGTCNHTILIDDPLLEIGDKAYHNTEDCFKCTTCRKSLYCERQGGNGVLLNGALYCRLHAEETTRRLVPTCFVCQKDIKDNHVRIREHPVHKECFKCSDCGDGFMDDTGKPARSAHVVDDKLFCHDHVVMRLTGLPPP
eukprot:m.70093 g.70093  ORF g.70093 m.70093 type:complete len:434 (+) comp13761_c0_seq1:206-1507(+)